MENGVKLGGSMFGKRLSDSQFRGRKLLLQKAKYKSYNIVFLKALTTLYLLWALQKTRYRMLYVCNATYSMHPSSNEISDHTGYGYGYASPTTNILRTHKVTSSRFA